jgi:hypothetical protein
MSDSAVPQVQASQTTRALAFDPAAVLIPLGLFIAIVSVAAPNGSYFPSSWGWSALVFRWAAAIGSRRPVVRAWAAVAGTFEVARVLARERLVLEEMRARLSGFLAEVREEVEVAPTAGQGPTSSADLRDALALTRSAGAGR